MRMQGIEYSRLRVLARCLLVCLGAFWFGYQAQPAYAEWPEQSCSQRHRVPVTVSAGPLGHDAEIRIALTDAFPSDVSLMMTGAGVFEFTDGAVASGLTFLYGGPTDLTDNVDSSTDGVNFTYAPIAPLDDTVIHVRFRPSGAFNSNDSGNEPSFTVRVLGRLD